MNRSDLKRLSDSTFAAAAFEWDVPAASITTKGRSRDVSQARSVALALLYDTTYYSYPALALLVAMESHTSALHAVRRGAELLESDPAMARRVKAQAKIEYANRLV